ncbi:MAG TPA: hypothetical protein VFP44_09705 [Usitatibacter sp.]|nr:hypothetical protein [Usitatibacter sp.]
MLADTALYLWGAYLMGLALVVVEQALLQLRERSIRRYRGWTSPVHCVDAS